MPVKALDASSKVAPHDPSPVPQTESKHSEGILGKLKPKHTGSSHHHHHLPHFRAGSAIIKILHEDREHRKEYRFVLRPTSKFRYFWDFGTSIFVLYLCWKIPFSVSVDWYVPPKALKAFDTFMDIWFAVDICLNFRTGFIHSGKEVMNPVAIRKHYLHFWFWVDLLASLPFELFGSLLTKNARKSVKLVKYFKLPRLLRLGRVLKYLRQYSDYYGSVVVAIGFLFAVHLTGCSSLFLTTPCDIDGYDTGYGLCAQDNIPEIYARALFIGVSTMIGSPVPVEEFAFGKDPREIQTAYYHFNNAVIVLGLCFVSAFFGNVFMLVKNYNNSGWEWRQHMNRVKTEMEHFELPHHLTYRIQRYYDYIWLNGKHLGKVRLLSDKNISKPLRREIATYLYKNLILTVPFFQTADEEFIGKLCMNLRTHVFITHDYICRRGEKGSELYIMNKGTAQVLSADESEVIATLQAGQFFGEMALLQENGKRALSVRAHTMCEVCGLRRSTFATILQKYPEFARKMRALAEEHMRANIESGHSPRPPPRSVSAGGKLTFARGRAGSGSDLLSGSATARSSVGGGNGGGSGLAPAADPPLTLNPSPPRGVATAAVLKAQSSTPTATAVATAAAAASGTEAATAATDANPADARTVGTVGAAEAEGGSGGRVRHPSHRALLPPLSSPRSLPGSRSRSSSGGGSGGSGGGRAEEKRAGGSPLFAASPSPGAGGGPSSPFSLGALADSGSVGGSVGGGGSSGGTDAGSQLAYIQRRVNSLAKAQARMQLALDDRFAVLERTLLAAIRSGGAGGGSGGGSGGGATDPSTTNTAAGTVAADTVAAGSPTAAAPAPGAAAGAAAAEEEEE